MESPTPLKFSSIPDPGNRYELKESVGSGVFGSVYVAIDSQAGGKRVAIKIQKLVPENEQFIQEEYKVLRDLSDHPNLPDFYGVYRKKGDPNYIWFVMELCEGGSALDLVLGLQCRNRRMSEEHIAYILRETIKALVHLHEHHTVHRDVRASNIMLTKDGEVKLVDFGLACVLDGPRGKRTTCIGSPCWMAPEVVTGGSDIANPGYGNRVDVWALGIVAIELGDGKPPFEDIHPTRAMFQIVRNPPPTLYRPSNWSQIYNDFINECLEKNSEYRPYIVEIIDHPFFENIPENDYYLTQELKQLTMEFAPKGKDKRKPECVVRRNLLKIGQDTQPERMLVEDLAALDDLNEDTIIYELEERLRLNRFQTFVGDVLLILNPNEKQDIYGENYHAKYKCKSRSDNAPHIYAVADKAFQDVQHHEEPQHIILAGETLSGKTTAMIHLMEHFVFLGESLKGSTGQQIMNALAVVHSLGNASTPTNPNSTRCILHTQLTFGGGAGKISGALFSLYQLEKWRVSTTNMSQSNFHIFYYFYDAMESENKLIKYDLEPGRLYRYLRITKSKSNVRPRDNPKNNHEMFKKIHQNLKDLLFDETQINIIFTTLAAILNLGNVQFKDTESKIAEIENPEVAIRVARLLDIDEKKFCWALTNYCLIKDGSATKRKHSSDEARDARDILAGNIYTRLVDWIVNIINYKLALGRAVFGDKYIINILDMYGFECFQRNKFEQILVNSFNEQIQYHYTQRVFAWEMLEQQEEHVPGASLTYCDNRPCVESLMATGTGIMAYLDEAAKNYQGYDHVIECLRRTDKKTHVKIINDHEFAVCHFTGTVQYDSREMVDKNRDFLPPEMVDCLRLSKNDTIRQFFTNALSKTGNLTLLADEFNVANTSKKERWGAALVKETQKAKKVDFQNRPGQYSQTRRMRTAASVFRATSLEVLRSLAIGAGSGGTHFVRCIRSDLANQPRGFRPDIVKQQLRALSILDTAKARQKGYPHRIPFQEFLKRYQFLAFDFDENVELTKDNCRLLLVRLKMEGWVIGKTKVFLKYYNEEFLSRLYETQVKKIIKVQCMMRTFLAKRNFASKLKKLKKNSSVEKVETKQTKQIKQKTENLSEESAALAIQKAYRGYTVRKRYGPLISTTGKLDQNTAEFLRPFASKWKAKSIFHVILLYRAARYQDTVYFSQQVHLYNQSVIKHLMQITHPVPLNHVDHKIRSSAWLGKRRPVVWKLPFNFDQLDYFDTSYMCDPYLAGGPSFYEDDQEAWDSPLRWRNTVASQMAHSLNLHESNMSAQMPGAYYNGPVQPGYMAMPFCREIISNPGSRCGSQASNYHAGNINHRSMYGVTPHQSQGNRCISQGSMYRPPSQQSLGGMGCGGAYRGCHSPIAKSCDDLRISPPNRNTSSGITPHNPLRTPTSAGNKPTPSNICNYEFDYNKSSAVTPSRYGVAKSNSPANPIKELERIGKKHTDDSDDDDPPFNFQGMLRKTNFNRDSMKRNKCNLDVSISQYRSSTPPRIYASDEGSDNENNESRNRNSNVVYQSNSVNSRLSKSCQDFTNRDQNKNEKLSWADEIEENGPDGPLDIVSTEIAPGVIVQGIVSDL